MGRARARGLLRRMLEIEEGSTAREGPVTAATNSTTV
jgi:hypothetical protein